MPLIKEGSRPLRVVEVKCGIDATDAVVFLFTDKVRIHMMEDALLAYSSMTIQLTHQQPHLSQA
jgi:hypothetical protein